MNDGGIKRYSLSKQVADKLEQMIESGEYGIGDKIPTEPELMVMFNVSRNTVREAVRALTFSGILEVKQGDGTYVKVNNSFNGYMNTKYEKVSVRDISEARNALEITIAHLAAERRTDEEMRIIEEKFKYRQRLNSTVKENTKADIDFHMSIAESCHNKLIYDLYRSISSFIENHISQRNAVTSVTSEVIDKLHEELYLSILNKDSDKASICAKNILNI